MVFSAVSDDAEENVQQRSDVGGHEDRHPDELQDGRRRVDHSNSCEWSRMTCFPSVVPVGQCTALLVEMFAGCEPFSRRSLIYPSTFACTDAVP